MRPRSTRLARLGLVRPGIARLCLITAALFLAGPGPAAAAQTPNSAQNESSYRYWSFWEQSGGGSWKYASKGPAVLRPEDGTVLGFRFALSDNSQDAAKPRGRTEFDQACASKTAEKDRKRIAVRVDFGTEAHAPRGSTPPRARTACASVADDASAAEALAAVAEPLRYSSEGLLCAIEGYPERGCGEQVADGDKLGQDDGASGSGGGDSASADQHGDYEATGSLGPVAGIGAAVAAVALLGAAAVRQARRRR